MVQQLNEGPFTFNWQQSTQFPDDGINSGDVVNNVKNIVNTVLKSTTTTEPGTTVPTEMTSTFAVDENTESSILTQMFGSNNTMMGANDTIVNEMGNSNSTVITAAMDGVMDNSGTDTVTTMVNTVVTSTETVVNTVTDAVSSMMPSTMYPTTEEDLHSSAEHHEYVVEDKTLYIVLGVILCALIAIMIILLVIYRRYKSNIHQRSGVYCVTDLNEVRISDQKAI